MAEIKVTGENFVEEVLESKIPVLVDFWADWCGPCKMVAPTLSEIAEEYDGKVKVCKLNVDEDPVTTIQYRVTSIPTILLFKNGRIYDSTVGVTDKEEFIDMINGALK